MKKTYITPELNINCVETKDVITVSVGDNGSLKIFSFLDIIDGDAGWV